MSRMRGLLIPTADDRTDIVDEDRDRWKQSERSTTFYHETIAFSNLRFLSVLFGYCRYLLTRASDTLDNGHDVFHLPFEHTCFSVVSSDKRFETLVCFLNSSRVLFGEYSTFVSVLSTLFFNVQHRHFLFDEKQDPFAFVASTGTSYVECTTRVEMDRPG
jgi:hypothetical protein